MRKKLTALLATIFLSALATSVSAQIGMGDDLLMSQIECNQIVLERLEEKEKFNNQRQKKVIVSTKNYDCKNGYNDRNPKGQDAPVLLILNTIKSNLKTGYDVCVGFCKQAKRAFEPIGRAIIQNKKPSGQKKITPKNPKKK